MMVLDDKKWKKLEDDIIKAGVMKYGTNKWSKISTLLEKKTPSQCKERWKIISPNNTQFSHKEVEKLLDLVKVFPSQWNAISKCFSNKSPHQCYEMYQKLLVNEAKDDFGLSPSVLKSIGTEDEYEIASKKVFNKDTGKFCILTCDSKSTIAYKGRILNRSEIDYSQFEEEERDMVDIARARLGNTKSRKDLKRSLIRQREDDRRRLKKLDNLKKRS